MSNKNKIMSQAVTADEINQLFRKAKKKFESNRKRHAKDNDRYAQLIALRQIESDYELQGGASSSSHADISQSVAPARSATPGPGTKAEFTHRLQMNIEALTQKLFRVKLDAVIDHGKQVFEKALSDDRREMSQQHERLMERVKLLAKQRANLTWFFNWGRLGIVGELANHFGAASSEGRTSGGLARFKAVSAKLQGHAAHLLGDFQSYRSMRAEQLSRTESEGQRDNKETEARADAGRD